MSKTETINPKQLAKIDNTATELLSGLSMEAPTGFAPAGGASPYIWWVWPGDKYASVLKVIPSLRSKLDVVLVDGQEYRLLNPFRFFMLDCQFFWAECDGEGQPVRTFKQRPNIFKPKEVFETLLIVLEADRATLVRCRFSSTKSNPAKSMIEALKKATSPEWLSTAQAKLASQIPESKACFRVVGEVLPMQIARTRPKENPVTKQMESFEYTAANAVTRPVEAGDLALLETLIGREDYRARMAACKADHSANVKALMDMMHGETVSV